MNRPDESGTPVANWRPLAELPRAYGPPPGRGRIRSKPEDFQVDEVLGFEPDGEGEHLLLRIRKRNTNTDWLARQLARLGGLPMVDVGYAGLKDRNAVTSQWFSLRLAGRPEPDWTALESDEVQILERVRHRRKLRRGALQGNRFRLSIGSLSGQRPALEQRLEQLRRGGFPNFFGEQRFGHGYANLERADALFARRLKRVDRHLRGLYISAARSQLFNQVLAARLEQGNWSRPLAGDLLMLEGTQSWFSAPEIDLELERRAAQLDLHPTGPLWGRGRNQLGGSAAALEAAVLADYETWRQGLEHCGLSQERRALRVAVVDLTWRFPAPEELELSFSLPAGSYATALLREVVEVD
jgi:tRNA pseudouridine13 synthase